MKSDKRILTAFLLNLLFSILEFAGGVITGSVAIASDAIHDLGDAATIGVSYFLEKKSRRQPDETHTYGYARYSVIGGFITNLVLVLGSLLVIVRAVPKIINPVELNYDGMLILAVLGVCVNFAAALITRDGKSVNQKAVNLHMLEDVLGWIAVLIGAVVIRFTGLYIIDPLLSVAIAAYIIVNSLGNFRDVMDLFLERTPRDVNLDELREAVLRADGVLDVHHIHIWSIDGQSSCATMHIVTDGDPGFVKAAVRSALSEHGIQHATLELERGSESCGEEQCHAEHFFEHHHHHHHHH